MPDHTTLSRRGRDFAGRQPRVARHDGPVHLVLDSTGLQLFGQGEWDAEKHGRTRRQWRKLHLAVAANTEGKREIVGLHIGPSEAETFWATFLKSMLRRGLRGVKLVISDAHEGLKAAIRRVVGASWQ